MASFLKLELGVVEGWVILLSPLSGVCTGPGNQFTPISRLRVTYILATWTPQKDTASESVALLAITEYNNG